MRYMNQTEVTAEDVLREGSPWRDCELWDGLPVVREPSGGWAEEVSSRVAVPLGVHVRERQLGWLFLSSQGFLVARRPDRLLASDTAYVSRARLPLLPRQGFIELAPDFLIETRSPRDSWEATVEKGGVWIAHGVPCVWAIDPLERVVAVLRPGEPPCVHRGTGRISAAPALPDFHMSLDELFEGLV